MSRHGTPVLPRVLKPKSSDGLPSIIDPKRTTPPAALFSPLFPAQGVYPPFSPRTLALPISRLNLPLNGRLSRKNILSAGLIFFILLLLYSSRQSSRPTINRNKMHNLSLDQLVLFGDSITQHSFNPVIQGWGAILADAYMRRLDVVNRGFSGYNTEWCKHVLADTLASTLPAPGTSRTPQIKVMTLFLGANDAVLPEKNQRQPVPIPQYKANLLEMLATVKSLSPDTRVVIITPPPVDPLRWHEKCKLKGKEGDREVGYTKLYRDACLEVGIEAKKTWGSALQVVDIWEVFFGKGQTEYTMDDVADLLSDGLHLAARGNTLLAAALLKTIKESWPDLNPEIVKPRVTFNEQVDRTKLPDILFKNYDDY